MNIEAKMERMGLYLPPPLKVPPGVRVPFSWVRTRGNRAYISGHGPQRDDGSLAEPFGKVGTEVTIEQAYQSAKLTGLSILGSLKRELGDLDRVTAWLRVFGMVNGAPGFKQQPSVINGFSDMILSCMARRLGSTSARRWGWPTCLLVSLSRLRRKSRSGQPDRFASEMRAILGAASSSRVGRRQRSGVHLANWPAQHDAAPEPPSEV